MKLSNKQYLLLLDLFHELNEAFVALPADIKAAFYERLQARNHARHELTLASPASLQKLVNHHEKE